MNYDEKTEKLKKRFDQRKKLRMKCHKCGHTMYSQKIWSQVEQLLKLGKQENHTHLLDQISNTKEIFYLDCPDCEAGQYIPK